jgi:hypothetical protein
MKLEIKQGNLLEVAGQCVGIISDVNEKTLLVRQGFVTYLQDKETFVASEKAVFVERKLIEDSYWIRIIQSNMSVETVDLALGRKLIGELCYMKCD